jgi:hypothetical protein
MLERESDFYCMKDDFLIDKKTGKQVTMEDLTSLSRPPSPEEMQRYYYVDDHTYDTLYIDGYQDCRSNRAMLSILSNSIKVQIVWQTAEWLEPHEVASFEVPYTSLEVVNVIHEREITALRTFLIGPLFAALFKKEDLFLNLGFRDEANLLQVPCFKIARGEIWNCYETIVRRLRKNKGLSEAEVLHKDYPGDNQTDAA